MKLDGTHDISLAGDGIMRVSASSGYTRADSAAQAVLCMLRTEEGEAFADPSEGVPWFRRILGLPASHLDVAARILRAKAEGVRGVSRVESLELDSDGQVRNVSGHVRIKADDGTTATEEF